MSTLKPEIHCQIVFSAGNRVPSPLLWRGSGGGFDEAEGLPLRFAAAFLPSTALSFHGGLEKRGAGRSTSTGNSF